MTRKEFFMSVVASIAGSQCGHYDADDYIGFRNDDVANVVASCAHDIVEVAETFWEMHEGDSLYDEDEEEE